MMALVPNDVPQHMSEGTKDVLEIHYKSLLSGAAHRGQGDENEQFSAKTKQALETLAKCKTWPTQQQNEEVAPIRVGDITITPYRVSHSVYDAYMLLITTPEKRILHTGDYRMHSDLGSGLIDLLRERIGSVDVLITEGTMIGRKGEIVKNEHDISHEMAERMRQFKYTFVLLSSMDAERILSARAAAAQAERYFAANTDKLCRMIDYFSKDWPAELRGKKLSKSVYRITTDLPAEKFLKHLRSQGFAMAIGTEQAERVKRFMAQFDASEVQLIYATWSGYYQDETQRQLYPGYAKIRALFSNIIDIHTPGHADVGTIAQVIETLHPKDAIIGIHKDKTASLTALNISEEMKSKIVPDRLNLSWITVRRMPESER